MMQLNHIFRKCTEDYTYYKSQEKFSHTLYNNDIMVFAKNEGELDTRIQKIKLFMKDIGMVFSIEKYAILRM